MSEITESREDNRIDLYLNTGRLSITTEGDVAYVHDLQGDEDLYTVARLYKRAMKIGKELKVKSAIISIDINRRDLFEMYARAGFKITMLWLQKDFETPKEAA